MPLATLRGAFLQKKTDYPKAIGFISYLLKIKEILIVFRVQRYAIVIVVLIEYAVLNFRRIGCRSGRFQGFVEQVGERTFLVKRFIVVITAVYVCGIYVGSEENVPAVIGCANCIRTYAALYCFLCRILKFLNEVRAVRRYRIAKVGVQATRIRAICEH